MVGEVIELISFWKEPQSPFLKDQWGLRDEGGVLVLKGRKLRQEGGHSPCKGQLL